MTAAAYYNENDAKTAAWLRELIKQKYLMEGEVDERSIAEVRPSDLAGYTRVHLFAGIGGWDYALQLAGWPADKPVWTGSCPCQPFSLAGKQQGQSDARHLWPEMFRLVKECRPSIVLGEQVASAIGQGWLDGISADLEGEGYACGSAVLGAHSVGAPHIRQRLFWVADAEDAIGGRLRDGEEYLAPAQIGGRGISGGVADATGQRREEGWQSGTRQSERAGTFCADRGVGNAIITRLQGYARHGDNGHQPGWQHALATGSTPTASCPWSAFDLIPCLDGKSRRVEPGSPPLAHGVPARVVRLRGYGNAIVPPVAAAFILASMKVGI